MQLNVDSASGRVRTDSVGGDRIAAKTAAGAADPAAEEKAAASTTAVATTAATLQLLDGLFKEVC